PAAEARELTSKGVELAHALTRRKRIPRHRKSEDLILTLVREGHAGRGQCGARPGVAAVLLQRLPRLVVGLLGMPCPKFHLAPPRQLIGACAAEHEQA